MRGSFINLVPRVCLKNRTERANFFANLCDDIFSFFISSFVCLRGCLRDNGATFITGRDEKLHRVYTKLCLLGCEPYSAVKLMKF